MYKKLKAISYIVIFTLFLQLLPIHTLAQDIDLEDVTRGERILLLSENPDEEIVLYEDVDDKKEISTIPNQTIAYLVEELEGFSKVSFAPDIVDLLDVDFKINSEIESFSGYVDNDFILKESDSSIDFDELLNSDTPDDINVESETTEIEEPVSDDSSEEQVEYEELESESSDEIISSDLEEEEVEVVDINSEEKAQEEMIGKSNVISTFSLTSNVDFKSRKQVQAIALQQSTKIYTKTATNSAVLKSYKQGQLLKLREHNKDWYAAQVYVKGKAQWGFIRVADVDEIINEKRINGLANVQSVKVYESPSRNAKVLKSYAKDKTVIYRTYTSQWHFATVYINGKAHRGYIHTSDVVPQPTYKAVAALTTVPVYQSMSKSSKKLKSYKEGHVITYRKNNSTWHHATVYINGKPTSGYIYASDLEDIITNQTSLQKHGLNSPTHVYSSSSKSSKVLKSYKKGHLLKFHTYTQSWYRTTVYINGKAHTGYIHKNDVGEKEITQKLLIGVASQPTANVYTSTSKTSKTLKSYKEGHILKFRTYSNDWYGATVYINGKAQKGYIHKNDVVVTSDKKIVIDAGHGGSDPGALGIGIIEKELTLDIALRTKSLLENAGATVIMTRSTDVFVSLPDRAAIANKSNADIFISIHGNSFNSAASGLESFWYGKYEKEKSIRLTHALQNNLIKSMGMGNRGAKEGNFHVIRETKMPSSLVEVGFIDNSNDAAKLRQSKYKQLAAEGILLGILDFFK